MGHDANSILKELIGPVAYRVYQRDETSKADIPFKLKLTSDIVGTAEARLISENQSNEQSGIWNVDGCSCEGVLYDVPAGKYRLEINVAFDGAIAAEAIIDPLFIGDLWVLAGQSNMEGCGKLIDTDTPVVGVSCFYMGDRWGLAEEPLTWLNESVDPVHWRATEDEREHRIADERKWRTIGAGLGLTFAKEIYEATGIPIGLIMCAHGGSTMSEWGPERADEEGYSLFGALRRKVRALGGKVKGCLWYQGESEANETDALRYTDRMTRWIAAFRAMAGDESLPFIYAQLSVCYFMDSDGVWWNRVQHEQWKLESQIDFAAMVPTIDAVLSDIIHLSTASLREVGHRFARQALRIGYDRVHIATGPRPEEAIWNDSRTALRLSLSGVSGKLVRPAQIYGFEAKYNGQRLDVTSSIMEDDSSLLFLFKEPVPPGTVLSYGVGLNPTVNVKDGDGVPLPVFAWVLE